MGAKHAGRVKRIRRIIYARRILRKAKKEIADAGRADEERADDQGKCLTCGV
jgi:hypothetical protein